MGQLVFQATLGGQVNLVGPNTASTFNINVPATAGTMVTTGDTGTVTNTMLASSAYTAPGTIGSGTPNTGAFTTLTTTGTINLLTVGRGAGAVATNTAVGASALAANTSGTTNTAIGYLALERNTTGSDNVGVGVLALDANTTGSNNVAVGRGALYVNTTASFNTAVGYQAGYTSNGNANVFVGYQAGLSATTGTWNTLVGRFTGYSLTTGVSNTFIGANGTDAAGYYITTGSKNTILGGYNGNQGGLDIRTANNYIVLSDGDGNPRLWLQGSAKAFLISVGTGAGTNAMRYNTSTGEITYDTSSARYKDNIRDSVYGLAAVMEMRSAQFEYKDTGRSDVGLIAEELQPIIPELVGINKDGEADSVLYDRMVSVLVKAIQELKAEFDAYKATHP